VEDAEVKAAELEHLVIHRNEVLIRRQLACFLVGLPVIGKDRRMQIVGDELRQREGLALTVIAKVDHALGIKVAPRLLVIEAVQARSAVEHPGLDHPTVKAGKTAEIAHVVNAAELDTSIDHGSST
jgi:hypothetical protein